MVNLPDGLMIGPGSQAEDPDGKLSYMPMPSGMSVYSAPILPEADEAKGRNAGMAALREVVRVLGQIEDGASTETIDLLHLDFDNRAFVDQVLGEGEVSVAAGATHQAQESVLAGVWRVQITDAGGRIVSDLIEVGRFPQTILDHAFADAAGAVDIPDHFGESVFNAPALLPEINEHIERSDSTTASHVINLSLLPHTMEDLELLSRLLGKGDVVILSRGYGNCRVTSTRTRNAWWVQYYNSQDTLILNSIEITKLPEVVCAAREDLGDSMMRLREILEVYE